MPVPSNGIIAISSSPASPSPSAAPEQIKGLLTSNRNEPSTRHRLATQSAADALAQLSTSHAAAISTGLGALDHALASPSPRAPNAGGAGFERGKVAEIWGPAGAGKTALVFQAAVGAITEGAGVLWFDCGKLLSARRLALLYDDENDNSNDDDARDQTNRKLHSFRYLDIPTLSHLLASIVHPPAEFPPEGTSLMVIEGLNMLVDFDYPRLPFHSNHTTDQHRWQAGRRYAILGAITTALNKLSILHNMAVVVTTGCSSKMRIDDGLDAAIGPGLGGSEWEAGIWARIVVFRDFAGRFAGVQKCQGRNLMPFEPTSDVSNTIGFDIAEDGSVRERPLTVDLPTTSSAAPVVGMDPLQAENKFSPAKSARKRIYEEIADSDEDVDEYGWVDRNDEEAVARELLAEESKAAIFEQQTT